MRDSGPSGDGTDPGLMYPKNGDPTDLSGGCTLDGGVAPCSAAMSVVNGGAGVATDPYEKPSTRWNPQANGGQGGFETFHAFADGYVGYGPIGARYRGNGVFRSKPKLGNYRATPSHYKGDWGSRDGEQLSECLRDALRKFFGEQTAQGKSYSPVDDATFKSGIPELVKITADPKAITLGLYDIHYDSGQMDLNGGSSDDLQTIIEELSHTVQFIAVASIFVRLTRASIGRAVRPENEAMLLASIHRRPSPSKGLPLI